MGNRVAKYSSVLIIITISYISRTLQARDRPESKTGLVLGNFGAFRVAREKSAATASCRRRAVCAANRPSDRDPDFFYN
jgi:hypothetical protein